MELGKLLKNERKRQKLSCQQLADKAGVTKRSILYWESGRRGMTVDNADKVLTALGVTIKIGKESDSHKL